MYRALKTKIQGLKKDLDEAQRDLKQWATSDLRSEFNELRRSDNKGLLQLIDSLKRYVDKVSDVTDVLLKILRLHKDVLNIYEKRISILEKSNIQRN